MAADHKWRFPARNRPTTISASRSSEAPAWLWLSALDSVPPRSFRPLGRGGEVYRARDTKLDRSVAIKILPDSFAHDPERLARFEREAKTRASLNHPNIAIIHGFEDAHGIQALVMELIEGPTLAERLQHDTIPLKEALLIARQIAEALEAAHEKAIIHRDLKPAGWRL